MEQHGGSDAYSGAADGRDDRFFATRQRMQEPDDRFTKRAASGHNDEVVKIVACAKDILSAGDDQASDAIQLARILDGVRHRLIHCKRERVFLFRPVHPDLAHRAFVADENVRHPLFQCRTNESEIGWLQASSTPADAYPQPWSIAMARSYYSTIFEQSADEIWTIIRDFNS